MAQNSIGYPTQALKHSLNRLIVDFFLITTLALFLGIPRLLARETTPPTPQSGDQAQPSTPVGTVTSEASGAMVQALDAQSKDSFVFLLGSSTESPLRASAGPGLISESVPTEIVKPLPIEMPDFKIPALEDPDEVAMLVSEQCSQNGTSGEGTTSCERIYSNGHHATILTQNANEGDEIKSQTVIEEFDSNDAILFKKTLRHRVDYNYLKDQKAKEKEFFDIIYQPAGGKTTRELMVYEYFLDTGKTRSLSWTQYEQIGNEAKAGLVYNALLRYGADGSPERAIAERWHEGRKAETYMNWNQHAQGFAALDKESWKQWEGWIRSASMQAYLP